MYYAILGVITAALIGLLIFLMKNRKEEDE
jgi:LPXTG-motif cell wall-anchored protein